MADSGSSPPCEFVGNSDVYGIGIRIGFYTQALAAWFANYFIASEARTLRPTNSLFVLALEIAMVIYAASPDEGLDNNGVYAIEVFVMLTILFALGWVTISDTQPRYSRRFLAETPVYTAGFHLLAVLALVFGNRYWWHGIDVYKPTPCKTSIWVIVPVDLYGWVRQLGRALNVYLLIWYGVEFLQSLIALVTLLRMGSVTRDFVGPNLGLSLLSRCKKKFHKFINRDFSVEEDEVEMKRLSARLRDISDTQEKAFRKVYQAENFLNEVIEPYKDSLAQDQLSKIIQEAYLSALGGIRLSWSLFRERALKSAVETYLATLPVVLALQHFRFIPNNTSKSGVPMTFATRSDTNDPGHRRSDARGTIQLVLTIQQHARTLRIDLTQLNGVNYSTFRVPKPPLDDLWKWVELAARVQKSHLPLKARKDWVILAVVDIIFLALLIVQVEVTLVLNHVQEVNTIKSFGQLLGLFVGACGLITVVYRKLSDEFENITQASKKPPRTQFDDAADVYLRWRARYEVQRAGEMRLAGARTWPRQGLTEIGIHSGGSASGYARTSMASASETIAP